MVVRPTVGDYKERAPAEPLVEVGLEQMMKIVGVEHMRLLPMTMAAQSAGTEKLSL